MNRDEIIRMAREAGWRVDSEGEVLEGDGWHIQTDIVERFAELVAAAEREACAKVCDVLADKHTFEGGYANECAIAIRERGAP
jgi:hypothetical protein